MIKTLKLVAVAIALSLTACGCKSFEKCSDGPVAPKEQSYEKSNASEPQLPETHVWWN